MCCIRLPCQLHRDTSRILDQCSDKLRRGTCSKNTVRFIKNDPGLTCAQCLIRALGQKASMTLEHTSCGGEDCLMTTCRNKNDSDSSWIEENLTEKLSPAHLQPTLPISPNFGSVSSHCISYSPGYSLPEELDSAELSHEEGLRLIDDMYDAQDQDFITSDYTGTNDEGLYLTWAGSHRELEEARNMTMEITDFVHNNGDGNICVAITSAGSPSQSLEHSLTPDGSETWDETDVEGHIVDESDIVQRTRWKLETIQNVRGEVEQRFSWCLDDFKAPVQISIEGEY